MAGTLDRTTQIVYRVNPRTSSESDTLTIEPDGRARWVGHGREVAGQLPRGLFAEIVSRLEQYSFKSVSGVHGDAMADYQHEIEVAEGPKKKARVTIRVHHESGALLGTAPPGIKEMVQFLDLIVARIQLGVADEDAPDLVIAALLRQIDFPYVNPHGEPGAFVLIDKRGAALPISSQRFSMPLGNGLLPLWVDDKVGFARPTGELVIPPAYLLTLGFSEGLAAVKTIEGWGYVDVRGSIVVPPQFTSATSFSDGMAHVHRDGQGGFLEQGGRTFPDPPFTMQMGRFTQGLAAFKALSNIGIPAWGYLAKSGKVAQAPTYDFAGEFSEGLAPAQLDDLFGYIDDKFQWIIEARFHEAAEFHQNLAAVGLDGKTGYVDRRGQLVIPAKFAKGGPFSEGLAPVVVGTRTGFIDATGRMVIEPAFDTAQPFSEGLAAVRVNHRWGYIDTRGQRVIEPTYESAQPFSGGMACVRKFAEPKPVVHTGSKKVIVNLGSKPKPAP